MAVYTFILPKGYQKRNTVQVKVFNQLLSSLWKMQFICLRDNWKPDDKAS